MTVDAMEAAVDDYIARIRPEMQGEFRYYRILRTDEDAVSRAALAQLPKGKRHWHQRRIPRASLEQSREHLLASLPTLRGAGTLDELFDIVNALIRPIPEIGELAVYDTAVRIGARFGLEPENVYVHAGTRDGARVLGFDGGRYVIEMNELPEPIRRLSGREAEDFLCRYKSKLAPP
jgi:hypothetical protein